MSKSSHFSGLPLYGQVIKLLYKSKILQFSQENGKHSLKYTFWRLQIGCNFASHGCTNCNLQKVYFS